jgi:CheY-like chemotaxis protein
MTADSEGPSDSPYRWARLRPEYQPVYPGIHPGQWFRVVERRHDPDVPGVPGYIRLDMAGEVQRVPQEHFEIVERDKRRILVVDDDPGIRKTLEIGLRKAGYEVLPARDGAEAMRLWQEGGADLIITDLNMPDKNGLEVIMELRAFSRSTPIIAISGGGRTQQLGLLDDAKLLGAVRTIAKPFSLVEMLAAVEQELGRH